MDRPARASGYSIQRSGKGKRVGHTEQEGLGSFYVPQRGDPTQLSLPFIKKLLTIGEISLNILNITTAII